MTDTTPPEITVQSLLNLTYYVSGVWANVTLSEEGMCNLSIDGTANESMSNTTGNFNDLMTVAGYGQHAVTFFCADDYGNPSSATVYFSFST